jgi:hypothetical protein
VLVWVTVLGPVRAWQADAELDLGAPQQRAVLAVLAAHADHPVSVGHLVDVGGNTGPAAVPPAVPPAQLPADSSAFCGRAVELGWAVHLVGADRPPATVVIVIDGTAGVGETALAVHVAHRVRDRFPDGQLYVNLRGFDPGGQVMAPGEAVRACESAPPSARGPASLRGRPARVSPRLASGPAR